MDTKNVESSFQLMFNSIINLSLKNDYIKIGDDDDIKRKYDVSYKIRDIAESGDSLIGFLDLHVNVSVGNDEDKLTGLKMSMTVRGVFTDSLNVSKEEFRQKLAINGTASLYSISRSIVAMVSSQALSGESLTLPMINVFKLVEQDK